jgi:tol-pal system protein YbgF
LPPQGPREILDVSNAALRSGELERAEAGYKEFLQRYPTSRLASEATFNLGDVYARRGRHREAAEQFLKVTTDFSKASQAPQSLHRLGQSLERLGAKEQACAAWSEVPRKYPSASQSVRAAAERDIKRASC